MPGAQMAGMNVRTRPDMGLRNYIMDMDGRGQLTKSSVENTAITFEYTVPTPEDFRERIARTLDRYPYLVAQLNGTVMGYAYASAFHPRAAYDWSAEVSIYVSEDARGSGIGTRLYAALEDILKQQNIVNVNACIAFPNPGSISFHEKLGYQTVGHFTKCGYKLGRWWDMIWMEKMLGDHPDIPGRLIPYPDLDL